MKNDHIKDATKWPIIPLAMVLLSLAGLGWMVYDAIYTDCPCVRYYPRNGQDGRIVPTNIGRCKP